LQPVWLVVTGWADQPLVLPLNQLMSRSPTSQFKPVGYLFLKKKSPSKQPLHSWRQNQELILVVHITTHNNRVRSQVLTIRKHTTYHYNKYCPMTNVTYYINMENGKKN